MAQKASFFYLRVLQTTKQILWECMGSILIAVGIYNFAVQAEFPMTGFSGISIILYRLLNIPIGLSTILLNIPVAILCYRLLGRKFFVSSLRCMIISSLIIDYVAPLFPVYGGSRLLAALCTGIFGGLGYAVIYIRNSSTGGSDFIIMAIKAVNPHLSLGNIAFLSDVGIILAGGILFRDIDGIIYGMIVNYIFAIVVDKVMYGVNAGKMALIVTNCAEQICRKIDARNYDNRGAGRISGNAKADCHVCLQQQGNVSGSENRKRSGCTSQKRRDQSRAAFENQGLRTYFYR